MWVDKTIVKVDPKWPRLWHLTMTNLSLKWPQEKQNLSLKLLCINFVFFVNDDFLAFREFMGSNDVDVRPFPTTSWPSVNSNNVRTHKYLFPAISCSRIAWTLLMIYYCLISSVVQQKCVVKTRNSAHELKFYSERNTFFLQIGI